MHQEGRLVNTHKERKLLTSLLKARDKGPASGTVRILTYAVIWIVIFFGTILYIKSFGRPSTQELLTYAGFWLFGIFIGALSICDAARKQWPVIKPHIDFDTVEKRIKELDA
jgi:hypothetical protein